MSLDRELWGKRRIGAPASMSILTLADMNVDVIFTFNRGEEGFNGMMSIKTDMFLALGWVSFPATLVLRYGDRISAATALLKTFQNKHQVRLALKSTFPLVS